MVLCKLLCNKSRYTLVIGRWTVTGLSGWCDHITLNWVQICYMYVVLVRCYIGFGVVNSNRLVGDTMSVCQCKQEVKELWYARIYKRLLVFGLISFRLYCTSLKTTFRFTISLYASSPTFFLVAVNNFYYTDFQLKAASFFFCKSWFKRFIR